MPTLTIQQAAKQANALARASISASDATFASLPVPRAGSSLGESLTALVRSKGFEPTALAKQARSELARGFMKARQPLLDAAKHLQQLRDISEWLDGSKAELPANLGPSLRQAALAIKAGTAAGICSASSVAAQMRGTVVEGDHALKLAKSKITELMAVAQTAASSQAADYFARCGISTSDEEGRKARAKERLFKRRASLRRLSR